MQNFAEKENSIPEFLDGYSVPDWLIEAGEKECLRGVFGQPLLSLNQLEFLLALAQEASDEEEWTV